MHLTGKILFFVLFLGTIPHFSIEILVNYTLDVI